MNTFQAIANDLSRTRDQISNLQHSLSEVIDALEPFAAAYGFYKDLPDEDRVSDMIVFVSDLRKAATHYQVLKRLT